MAAIRPIDRVFQAAELTTLIVPLIDLKAHLNVVHIQDDELITGYAVAAQNIVERTTGRLLSSRACTLKLMNLPTDDPVELPGGVVNSLTSVTVDGVAVTGCAVHGDSPARLYPASSWPGVNGAIYPVIISYTAGYTTPPGALKAAVSIIVADMYDRRESVTPDAANPSPYAAIELMRLYRIRPI